MISFAAQFVLLWGWPGGIDNEGPADARLVWEGEHVQLYRETLAASGAGSVARTLEVYSRGGAVAGPGAELVDTPSLLMPADWGAARARVEREIALTMFANLPDESYSLADWALGNERCPLDGLGVPFLNRCFNFKGWMGALNSTHFPPQSYAAYAWYHDIALGLAAHCIELEEVFAEFEAGDAETEALIFAIQEECAFESLAFEGVGHHYLQDTWSSGHTWERWGSPDPADWIGPASGLSTNSLLTALAVGGIAGTIHGHEPLSSYPDPMCTPHEDVEYVPGPETPVGFANMVGDYHLAEMSIPQAEGLRRCTQGGVDEVLEALGNEKLGMSPQGTGVAPSRDACFSHRAHDLAWATGMLSIGTNPSITAMEGGILLRVLGRTVLAGVDEFVKELPELPLLGTLIQETREELVRFGALAERAAWSPDSLTSTDLATQVVEGTELTFLGAQRNSAYVDKIASGLLILDPRAEVILGSQRSTAKFEEDADAIRRTFHQAHADWWCTQADLNPNNPASELRRARETCQTGDTEGAREAGCGVCTTLGSRIARIGNDEDDWDQSRPPLCAAFGPQDTWLYVDADENTERSVAVQAWCEGSELGWAATDSQLWRFSTSAPVDQLADDAEFVTNLPGEPRAMTGNNNQVFASVGGEVYVVDWGGASPIEIPGCAGAAGLDYSPIFETLYVACEDSDTIASLDTSKTPPLLINTFDMLTVGAERPSHIAVSPDEFQIAVSSFEFRSQRDGVTIFDVIGGDFLFPHRIGSRFDVVEFDGGGNLVELQGVFHTSTYDVAWLTDTELVSSNFSNLECTGAGVFTCLNVGHHLTRMTSNATEATDNLVVFGRTREVARLWNGRAAVAGYNTGELHIVEQVDVGETFVDLSIPTGGTTITASSTSRRIFLGHDSASGTCGMTIVDASDDDPNLWSMEDLSEDLGCVRAVLVPRAGG